MYQFLFDFNSKGALIIPGQNFEGSKITQIHFSNSFCQKPAPGMNFTLFWLDFISTLIGIACANENKMG